MNKLSDIENLTVEFKTSFNEDVIETLVAFSNAKGGTVYIGVSDTGKVQGITIGKETVQNWINEIKLKTSPQIVPDAEVLSIEDKTVVLLYIIEYPIKPVSTRGKYFKRVGNSNHLLSVVEVANMHLQTVNSSWDYYPRPNKTINDISLDKATKAMNIIKRRNDNCLFENVEEFLIKNELLLEDNKITNGCFLMFSKDENLFTTIQMGHFASEIVIKDDVVNSDDILTQVEEVMMFIRKHINKELIITKTQVENIQRWQYPLDALREIVLNMIIHRDYTAVSNSIIKIFSDHILFFNPGVLPSSITIEQLKTNKYISTPRNRQIAKMAKEMGLIERYGTGIKRVRNMFIDYGLKEPQYEIMSDGMAVTVFGLIFETDTINNNEENVPINRGDVPENSEDVPINREDVPINNVDVPENVTINRGDVPENSEDVPENVTINSGDVPENSVDVPENVPINRGDVPLKSEENVPIKQEENITINNQNIIVNNTQKQEKNVTIKSENNVTTNLKENITTNISDISEKMSRKILLTIEKHPKITTEELAKLTDLTTRTVKRYVSNLKQKGLIERVGANKNGYWKVNINLITNKLK